MGTRITLTTARLNDGVAMAGFLAPIPNAEQLDRLLTAGGPFASRAYDDDTWTARFVSSNGSDVQCFTVTDITIDQAEMIAAACHDTHGHPLSAFSQAVALALGPTFDPDG